VNTIPLKSRIYIFALAGVTSAVLLFDFFNGGNGLTRKEVETGFILFTMIAIAERCRIDFPNRTFHFSVSVGAILSLGAAFTLPPLYSAAIVIFASVLVDLSNRLKSVQLSVNAANLGLATYLAGTVYWAVANDSASPISSFSALLATVIASTVYTIINLGSLSMIVAPVINETPTGMWRANFSATFVFVSLPMLGTLVPITAGESGLGVLILTVPLVGSHLALRNLRRVELETQATMASLSDALEVRDENTHQHSVRVTQYVQQILDELPHVPSRLKVITLEAARIHDVGKIGIRDLALLKDGPLSDEEWLEVKRHPAIGADLVSKLSIYRDSSSIVRHHHEWWDGSGYPDRLREEAIPLGARIIAVADSFDAMTSNRPYRKAMTTCAALEEIVKYRGKRYDPMVVDAFERALTIPVPVAQSTPVANGIHAKAEATA
jgi:HD-GYP domain-containing protein (c-di-GMP phosphodiesterase class II)